MIKIKKVIKPTCVALAIGLGIFALSDQLVQLPSHFDKINFTGVLFIYLGLVVYQAWNASVWSDVLASLGTTVDKFRASRIWVESECMKWIPGGIWSYGSRIVRSNEIEVSKKQAASSIAFELIITNIAWFTVALMFFTSPQLRSTIYGYAEAIDGFYAILLGVSGVFFIVALLLKRSLIVDKLKSIGDIKSLRKKKTFMVYLNYLVLCFFNASLFYAVILSIHGVDVSWQTSVAVAAIAWLVSFWAVFAPGGLGVREAVLTILLTHFCGVELALLIALLWRVLQMLSEFTVLMLSLFSGVLIGKDSCKRI